MKNNYFFNHINTTTCPLIQGQRGFLARGIFGLLLIASMFFAQTANAQLALQNITCTGCTTTGSTGYSTPALAGAGSGAATTAYSFGPGVVTKQCATVVSDVNGTLGIINAIQATAGSCISNTSATRKGSLYLASAGACTGPEIQAVRKGSNSSTFNNEYVGLTPNTTYIFVFQTTIDGTCGAGAYTSSSVRYYGGVPPQFAFNCGSSLSAGSYGVGTASTGSVVVPITGTLAGAATFNVSGTGFTGTLSMIWFSPGMSL